MPWRLQWGRGLVSCFGDFACLSWKSQLRGIARDNFGVNDLCIQSSYLKTKQNKKRSCLAETWWEPGPYTWNAGTLYVRWRSSYGQTAFCMTCVSVWQIHTNLTTTYCKPSCNGSWLLFSTWIYFVLSDSLIGVLSYRWLTWSSSSPLPSSFSQPLLLCPAANRDLD